jgi:cephalosporin hydroxylase
MKEQFDFHSQMLNHLLYYYCDDKIQFSQVTNWHNSHPYYRLNYYNGINISQVLGIYFAFNKDYLSNYDNIIEIGSYNGGLSSYIFDSKKKGASFVSYDIAPEINDAAKQRSDIDFRIGDCFEEKYTNEIIELINKPGKTLMICDGGHKTKEFNLFSKYLKSGDVIILHDYKQDNISWNQMAEYWQWPYGFETSYEEIKDAIIENNLEEFRNKEFNFFAWGSYIKK